MVHILASGDEVPLCRRGTYLSSRLERWLVVLELHTGANASRVALSMNI